VRLAFEGYDARAAFVAGRPELWRFGTAESQRLERCLARAARRVPRGGKIAFLSSEGAGDDSFFRWRWAAYFLPGYDVVPEVGESPVGLPDAVVAFDQVFSDPRFALAERRRSCRVYLQRGDE
jgi:hypothetical protein